jgi:hypothetical protein
MSGERTARRLLRGYPPAWRARYGEELIGVIVETSREGRVPWRVRADVTRAAARERLRGAGLGDGDGDGDGAESRVRSGAVVVLWAWALFIIGGALVAKTSEHWLTALGGGHGGASMAFTVLIAGAVVAGLLVCAGIGLALPAFVARLQAGDWPRMRRRLAIAAALTAASIAATAGLVVWAHGLSAVQRNGHDTGYGIAFLAWAALGVAALLAWTDAAVNGARGLALRRPILRAQARLAAATAAVMAAMAAATATWWVLVGAASPAALTGAQEASAAGRHATAAVPELIAAVVLMVLASTVATAGARRATVAAARL